MLKLAGSFYFFSGKISKLDEKKLIRMATAEDAEGILHVHYDAVHTFAARSYRQEILDEWSSVIDERRIAATR